MIHNKRVPLIDGLRIDEAHKGKGASGPSKAQLDAEAAQTKELEKFATKRRCKSSSNG
jgi:hypothetical protein